MTDERLSATSSLPQWSLDAGLREQPARLSIEEFIAERGESLMRLAYLIAGSKHDAEDLFQETFADVHRKWARVAASDSPYAYVRTMMANRYTSSRRRKWHGERPSDPHAGVMDTVVAPDGTGRIDSDDALWRLLATLPPRMRAVLVLRYVEDLDDQTIAETLGVAVGTVRAAASRGLAQLRERGDLT
ncbi:SigE family RNA polymerase sigma factor [Janibacter sp. G56]|uniref:SigE family RNA polymerase sigma factor n=1 Tax=Janibacter sp. G56 TaxID=3418717 RepID=UPI003D04946C